MCSHTHTLAHLLCVPLAASACCVRRLRFYSKQQFTIHSFELSNSHRQLKQVHSAAFDHLFELKFNRFKLFKEERRTIKMISNGYKVIGIEENGDVEYDVMSSCPVSKCTLHNVTSLEKKKCIWLQSRLKCVSSIFYSIWKVSPSKPVLYGSEQKSISKEIKEAIKQFLSSNRTSLAVSTVNCFCWCFDIIKINYHEIQECIIFTGIAEHTNARPWCRFHANSCK